MGAICSPYQTVSPFSSSFCSHLASSEMSLVLTHVTIQIQFSVDTSNVVHTFKKTYLHIREHSWIAWKEKLLQSCLLPSRLDSGREQLIIFLLWVRILISISAHRKCNIFGAGNSSSSRYSLALRRSVPRRGKRHKIMWEELEARAAAAQLEAGN